MNQTSEPGGAAAREKKPVKLSVFLLSCFKISAFTFGGGYVIVPLQKRRFVDELGWFEEDEMLDMIAIAQSAPGPIAINASIITGYRLFGVRGGVLAAIATALPPLLILTVVSYFYTLFAHNPIVRAVLKGMQAAVAALIIHTIITMTENLIQKRSAFQMIMFLICLLITLFTGINVAWLILASALASLLFFAFQGAGGKGL